jgi:hypothetical protein
MKQQLQFQGKSFTLTLSDAAQRVLAARSTPLIAEMELYFSCLIRLKVRFREQPDLANTVKVMDNLHLRFRPVMTAQCDLNYEGDEPPLTDFPIAKPEAFVPHWLTIDYRHGELQGEFGYA